MPRRKCDSLFVSHTQPVLLLQISFHELQTVYLLDLQTMLRPLMSPDTTMNDVETEVSKALSPLLESKFIIKVGYQLCSDLRRTFASYPHLPCFQEVQSTLEISSFIKKVLHISKQKKSRYITTSLAAMTSHYLGMTVDKECRKYTFIFDSAKQAIKYLDNVEFSHDFLPLQS